MFRLSTAEVSLVRRSSYFYGRARFLEAEEILRLVLRRLGGVGRNGLR